MSRFLELNRNSESTIGIKEMLTPKSHRKNYEELVILGEQYLHIKKPKIRHIREF